MTECRLCGAPLAGGRCEYCRATAGVGPGAVDEASEYAALQALHVQIAAAANAPAQAHLLRNAFLPISPSVLMDAGFRCFGFLHPTPDRYEVAVAAFQRLRAVIAKLETYPQSEAIGNALAQLKAERDAFSGRPVPQQVVASVPAAHRKKGGCGCLTLIILFVLVAVIVRIVKDSG